MRGVTGVVGVEGAIVDCWLDIRLGVVEVIVDTVDGIVRVGVGDVLRGVFTLTSIESKMIPFPPSFALPFIGHIAPPLDIGTSGSISPPASIRLAASR
jgi:hypothetical protein